MVTLVFYGFQVFFRKKKIQQALRKKQEMCFQIALKKNDQKFFQIIVKNVGNLVK